MLSYHLTVILMLINIIIVLLCVLWKQRLNFWKRHRIAFERPLPIFGNLRKLIFLRMSFGDFFKKMHARARELRTSALGIYILHTPALIVRDPELIKAVLIKNFHMFLNRYEAADPIHDFFGSVTLPLSKYPIWRESRKRIAAFFTSGMLKQRIYPLMLEIAKDLEEHIVSRFENIQSTNVVIELKEMCALYTLDLTSLLSFSIHSRNLQIGNSRIRQQVLQLLKPTFRKAINFFAVFFLPHWTATYRAKVFPRQYTKFMRELLEEQLKKRCNFANSATKYHDGDLIDILLQFRKESIAADKFQFAHKLDFIVSQMAVIILAGFETSSSSIAFILYELAKQPDLQRRLRLELNKNFAETRNGFLSYEQLLNLQYLNMIVSEGLRMYPAASFVNRECTPGPEQDGVSLEAYNIKFKVPRGMPVYISILGIHHDPQFWPNPNIFDPERFAPENLYKINPMTYLPFGLGPHACVGSRLGLLQVKLGLAHILKDYYVEFCNETPKEIIFEPTSFMLCNKDGISLRFCKDIKI